MLKNFLGKNSQEWTSRQKNIRQRVTELGRKTREEIAKWNQMTAQRFQTEGETSDIPGIPFGGITV